MLIDPLTTAARSHGRGAILALAIGVVTLAAAHAQPPAAPTGEDLEIRTVKDDVAPCLNVRESPSYSGRILGCAEAGSVERSDDGSWRIVAERVR